MRCHITFAINNQPSTIIHLAARAGVRSSIQEPILYEKVNVGGTLKMLELAKELKVKHFIFGSSSSVYGNPSTSSGQTTPFNENAPCNQPISPYAATKRSGELLCFTYSNLYKIPTTVLRFFTVYGPRNRPDMAAFKFMDAITKEKPIDFYGQDTSRDYTFVDDIVDGILSAINTVPDNFEIFNLGNSSPTKLSEFINIIEKIDIIETPNSRTLLGQDNRWAERVARKYNRATVAGSDAHNLSEIDCALVEMNQFFGKENFIRRLGDDGYRVVSISKTNIFRQLISIFVRIFS